MKVVLVFIAVVQGCLCASLTRDAPSCLHLCPGNYAPVCGTNGYTYSNHCALESATCTDNKITLLHTGACSTKKRGVCPDVICFALYDPVCASNGQTYSNTCVFNGANCNNDLTIVGHGSC